MDGNDDQIRLIREVAQELRVEITLVLDPMRVLEYAWKAAYCFEVVDQVPRAVVIATEERVMARAANELRRCPQQRRPWTGGPLR